MKLVWSQNQILPLSKLQKWHWMMATQKALSFTTMSLKIW
jgi:hypothetical protein